MFNAVDLTGRRFGKLVALEPTGERRCGSVMWRCQCDCGKQKDVPAGSLNRPKKGTQSCGCLFGAAKVRGGRGRRNPQRTRCGLRIAPDAWNAGAAHVIPDDEPMRGACDEEQAAASMADEDDEE